MICLVHVNPLPCIPNTCTYKLTLCMCQWCYFNILKFLVQSYVIETVWSQCGILKHNFKSQVTNSMLKLRTGIKKKLMVSRVCEEPSIKSCTEVCSMKSIFLWLAGFKTWLAMELPLLLQKYLLMHFLIAYLNLHCLIFWSNLGEMVIVDQCVFFYNNSYFLCTGNILCEYNQLFLTLAISALPGKNNGKGYYIYEKGGKPKPDPSILPIIEESRRLCNIMPNGKVVLFGSVM